MKIHHIGYLVKNIESAMRDFTALEYHPEDKICFDALRGIDLCFMRSGEYLIELVMPKNESSIVWNLLKKNGIGPYHICYETDNLQASIELMKGRGYVELAEPQTAVGLSGRKVSFLTGRSVGMIELVEV